MTNVMGAHVCGRMPDAQIATSPPNADIRAQERTRARRLVTAWLAGAATPPEDDLRIEPLRAGAGDELCFCADTFCWPPLDPTRGQPARTHPE